MATVPAEITFTAGAVLTAAQLNTNLRDAINFIIAPPYAVLRQTSAQAISSATWTGLTFDVEDLDRDGMHSTTSNTSRATAVTAGYYAIKGALLFTANGTGNRGLVVQVNGSASNRYGKVQWPGFAGGSAGLLTSRELYLNVGDYAEIACNQTSGGSLNTVVTEDGAPGGNPSMTIRWVST